MKLRKTAVALMIGAFVAVSAMPAVYTLPTTSVAFAARGGARISAPKAAPAAPKAAPSAQPSNPGQNSYAPSKDAKSLSSSAPAANAKANAAAATKSSTPWGGIMRSVGLFAGGMLLGGLLSNLFGMGGTGFMSEVMGLIMNLVILGAVVMLARMLWTKFKNRSRRPEENVYRHNYSAPVHETRNERTMIDVTPPKQERKMEDIIPPKDGGYDPKSMADRYRSR